MTVRKIKSPGPPPPSMDLSDYYVVTILSTGDVDGHTFRRGERSTVNSATLKALKARSMVDADDAKPAG